MLALLCLRRRRPSSASATLHLRDLLRYSTLSPSRVEQVSVPCRSNGNITLNLFHPVHARPSSSSPSVILYLPPGPVLPTTSPVIDVGAALSSVTSATVVQINYRLSQHHQYPTPIHDVLTGYDWVLEHLLPTRAIIRPGRSTGHAIKIAVCGELVGGSLASMLALTECRIKGPYIAAAAVNEPIVDWVFPESEDLEPATAADRLSSFARSLQSKQKSKPKLPKQSFVNFANNGIINADVLLKSRSDLFRRPADYFDTFASPLFNFRAPGVSVPPAQPVDVMDEFAEISLLEKENFHRQQLRLGAISDRTSDAEAQGDLETSKKSRKSNRRWPSLGSGLRIPQFRISSADTSPLSDQVVEFANQLQRNIVSQELKTTAAEDDDESKEAAYMLAERQIHVEMSENTRLWSLGQTHDLRRIAHWFEQIIG